MTSGTCSADGSSTTKVAESAAQINQKHALLFERIRGLAFGNGLQEFERCRFDTGEAFGTELFEYENRNFQ